MKHLLSLAALAALLGTGVMPLGAHHSFAAEFDANAPITIKGKLAKVDWVNPHSWVHVDVTGADGKVTTWRAETPPPNGLIRRGYTKSTFKLGSDITVEGFRAKDGTNTMNAQTIKMNGKDMFTGSAGDPGAPPAAGASKSK
jgi:hypothetical protein